MARNFNSNQNRHLYVAKQYVEPETFKKTKTHTEGDITVVKTQGPGNVGKGFYFLYQGADTVLKSELIQVKNLDYVKAIKAKNMRVPFKSQIVTLKSAVNSGKPVSGQDYILRIVLRQWVGMSDEDVYYKEAAVHATKEDEAAENNQAFYQKFVDQLNLVFAREVGASKESNPYLSFVASADGITITEKAQPYTRGLEQQLPVLFDAEPTTIYVDGEDVIWGEVNPKTEAKSKVEITGDAITGRGNGTDIADLEYFSMGERGDQYRMIGWPNVIPTKYMVDPTKEYNVLEIHHAFTDDGISSYRSDKDITIVAEDVAVINSLVQQIATDTGLTLKNTEDANVAPETTKSTSSGN